MIIASADQKKKKELPTKVKLSQQAKKNLNIKIYNKEHLHSAHFFRWEKNAECINRLYTILKAL